LWHALVIEWHLPAYQHVQHDTKTPDIHLWACVLACLQELRRCKVQASTKGLQQVPGREKIAEAKVDDLDVPGFTDEYILNFKVSVDDAVPMAVV
jgi:hypothetical protein